MSVRHLRTSGERSGLENKLGVISRRRIFKVMRLDENSRGVSVDTEVKGSLRARPTSIRSQRQHLRR